ncbi:MAG: hypothetical protein LUD72_13280 [Bacteroidales bacterium]|nr:hypothetical protein [Bacteroidales bacterium]
MLPDSILGEISGAHRNELNYDDTGRLIWVISGLSKQILGNNGATCEADHKLMRRALAFTHRIGARNQPGTSKNIEVTMPLISEMSNKRLPDELRKKVVNIKTRHCHGGVADELGEPDEPEAAMRLSSDEATMQLQLKFGEFNGAIFAKLV